MSADMRTYWDNDGIIDKALTVALVRRDRPGLRFLAKIDPRAIMLPDKPLPGRPSDAQLDADTSVVMEQRVLNAMAFQQGAAEYLVTGAFSKWWTGPSELHVTDPLKRVCPPELARPAPDGRPWRVRPRTSERRELRLEHAGDQDCLVVPIRAGLLEEPAEVARGYGQPWVTLVGFRLCSRGGGCGGNFAVEHSESLAGEVLIPLGALAPTPSEGHWLFLGLVAGELLPTTEIDIGRLGNHGAPR